MEIGKRIHLLRKKHLNLRQIDFAKTIGLKQAVIGVYENGGNVPENIIISICRVHNVNESWLRNGEGEMFIPTPKDELEAFVQRYNPPPYVVKLLECCVDATAEKLRGFELMLRAFVEKCQKERATAKTLTADEYADQVAEAARKKALEEYQAQHGVTPPKEKTETDVIARQQQEIEKLRQELQTEKNQQAKLNAETKKLNDAEDRDRKNALGGDKAAI